MLNQENKNGCSFLKPDRVNTIAVRIKTTRVLFSLQNKRQSVKREHQPENGKRPYVSQI